MKKSAQNLAANEIQSVHVYSNINSIILLYILRLYIYKNYIFYENNPPTGWISDNCRLNNKNIIIGMTYEIGKNLENNMNEVYMNHFTSEYPTIFIPNFVHLYMKNLVKHHHNIIIISKLD